MNICCIIEQRKRRRLRNIKHVRDDSLPIIRTTNNFLKFTEIHTIVCTISIVSKQWEA